MPAHDVRCAGLPGFKYVADAVCSSRSSQNSEPDGGTTLGRCGSHSPALRRQIHLRESPLHVMDSHQNTMTDLEPIGPQRAVELYIDHKQTEYATSTVQSHRSRLKFFLEWCAHENIENMNTLTGRDLYNYRVWRKNEGELNRVSLKSALATLRAFIRFCEGIEAVEQDLHIKVQLPLLSKNENVRDVMLEAEAAEAALEYLQKFEYASRNHVVLELLWHTALRTGSLRALDLEDYHPEEQYLEVLHRPDTETPLKKGRRGTPYRTLRPPLLGAR